METNALSAPVKKQLCSGITAFLLTTSMSIAFAVVTSQSLMSALVCIVACAFLSLTSKESVCAPHPLFVVPFYYVCAQASPIGAVTALSTGAALYMLVGKKLKKTALSNHVLPGVALGLCLGATILLTNVYFGIGASGATPLLMLKSYRSLGFHPHFMGLLTGTITLFTMITYPFKFKKLSKILPAPFITVTIPYLLNLFLNPQKNLTAINESTELGSLQDFSFINSISEHTLNDIPFVLQGVLVFFLIFYATGEKTVQNSQVCNIASIFPCAPYSVASYGLISALLVTALSIVTFLLFPDIFSRIPLHSIGAMLIVAGWQSLPYKKIGEIFKEKHNRLLNIIIFIICVSLFVVFDVFTATVYCVFLSLITGRKERKQ